MNIDGATAVIYCELGLTPELGRGVFILSRSVGILAHANEQMEQGVASGPDAEVDRLHLLRTGTPFRPIRRDK